MSKNRKQDQVTILGTSSELERLISESVDLALTSKKKPHIVGAFTAAFEHLESVSSSIPPKVSTFSNTKRSLKVVTNLLGGILDGLDSNDLSLKELRSLSKELRDERLPIFIDDVWADNTKAQAVLNRTTDIPTMIRAASKTRDEEITDNLVIALSDSTKEVKKSISSSKTFEEALHAAIKDIKTGSAERVTDKQADLPDVDKKGDATRNYLKGLSSLRSTIPATAGRSGFTIIRLPIVPVFKAVDKSGGHRAVGLGPQIRAQPNPSYVLKEAGIRSTSLEEYVIIDNQLLLAVSKSNLPEKELKTKSNRKKVGKMEPLEYAKLVLSVIEDTTDKSYAFVDEKPLTNPKNSDVLFFWIMPSKTLSFLLRKGFPKIHQWGLPF